MNKKCKLIWEYCKRNEALREEKMKRLLITGATGFVGSHLVKDFLKDHEVDILIREKSDTWRIKDALHQIHQVWKADLSDKGAVDQIITVSKPEVVIHTAAYGCLASQNNPKIMLDTNVLGTLNLLNAAQENGCLRFINTGNSSHYFIKYFSLY